LNCEFLIKKIWKHFLTKPCNKKKKIGEIIPPNKTRKLGQNMAKKIIFIFLKKVGGFFFNNKEFATKYSYSHFTSCCCQDPKICHQKIYWQEGGLKFLFFKKKIRYFSLRKQEICN
jgi:hypothetical protein